MKEAVIIKNFQNGLHMIMDPDLSFQEILRVLSDKLDKSRSFFGNAQVALTVSGRTLLESEEVLLVDTVMEHSDLEVICIMSKDETSNKTYIKALQKILDLLPKPDQGILIEESLKNGAVVKSENNVVILGNVMNGCKVVSGKNIIIMGALYGEAIAGGEQDESAVVIALEMFPEEISIGPYSYTLSKKEMKKSAKALPQIAHFDGKKIVLDNLTNDKLIFS